MKTTWRTEWPHALLIAAQFALAAVTWNSAPDRIPVHFGFDGQVDRYGGKFEGLLVLPLVSVALYFVMRLLPRFDPGRANYANFAGPYATMRLSLTVALATIYGISHLTMLGEPANVATMMPLLMGAVFILLGGVLGKVRPNWFVGIRTPWTLSSKQAWNRTHRVGGWVFMVLGVLTMAAAALRAEWAVWTVIAGPLAAAVGLSAYSYVVWRGDPERIPPAGTLPAGDG